MNIEEIQNEVAIKHGFKSWDDLMTYRYASRYVTEVCKRYASECCKATLEKACINMNHNYPGINTYSVRDESNITLL
jgi:hypothetical protein